MALGVKSLEPVSLRATEHVPQLSSPAAAAAQHVAQHKGHSRATHMAQHSTERGTSQHGMWHTRGSHPELRAGLHSPASLRTSPLLPLSQPPHHSTAQSAVQAQPHLQEQSAYRHLTMTGTGLSALGPLRRPLRDGVTWEVHSTAQHGKGQEAGKAEPGVWSK